MPKLSREKRKIMRKKELRKEELEIQLNKEAYDNYESDMYHYNKMINAGIEAGRKADLRSQYEVVPWPNPFDSD
jgi:hypothetical protein